MNINENVNYFISLVKRKNCFKYFLILNMYIKLIFILIVDVIVSYRIIHFSNYVFSLDRT